MFAALSQETINTLIGAVVAVLLALPGLFGAIAAYLNRQKINQSDASLTQRIDKHDEVIREVGEQIGLPNVARTDTKELPPKP